MKNADVVYPSQNLQPWAGLQPLETAANPAYPAFALWQLLVPLSLWGFGDGMSQGTLKYPGCSTWQRVMEGY